MEEIVSRNVLKVPSIGNEHRNAMLAWKLLEGKMEPGHKFHRRPVFNNIMLRHKMGMECRNWIQMSTICFIANFSIHSIQTECKNLFYFSISVSTYKIYGYVQNVIVGVMYSARFRYVSGVWRNTSSPLWRPIDQSFSSH